MSKEKQIEEMCDIAHKAVTTYCGSRYCPCDRCMFKDKPINCDECAIAHELYNAGYRKQSEGEWHYNPDGMDWGLGAWECSLCRCKNDNLPMDKNINPLRWAGSKYCPNCGAKMKGR